MCNRLERDEFALTLKRFAHLTPTCRTFPPRSRLGRLTSLLVAPPARWVLTPFYAQIMQNFEGLGTFYLGRRYDMDTRQATDEIVLYDSKDLTTHAVCVGMTGSGKTGLCLSLLEEAAIDGIPAIAIDPKGDLGNLLLTFPNLQPSDFRPWIETAEAARHGMSPDEYASDVAQSWLQGLTEWGQDGARIQRFRDAVDIAIYTPGSSAGMPLTVLRSFDAPSLAVLADPDALRERIAAAASGLLALLGIDADPLRSREHILISNIFDHAWRGGRNLDLAALMRDIQTPPFDKVGFVDLETFFPAVGRAELAMNLNNLLASPTFAGWMEGEPLNIQRLFYTAEGKPRLTILSIAHLSETERMFFVTILLNELLSWVRAQPGTSSLRAVFYMDEVFGYFPPSANPPAKKPMLTLLKQARAYGLGVILATQNPVDLDYKGLSNTGTWFLGRLQTERDKQRVLEGLEGASAAAGSSFDRSKMEATLAGLGKRVFLMNNVHDDEPIVFQTRWALSYLRGPLTRAQIQTLMGPRKAIIATGEVAPETIHASMPTMQPTPAGTCSLPRVREAVSGVPAAGIEAKAAPPPLVPATITQRYLRSNMAETKGRVVYRPALFGNGRLHFVKSTCGIDVWRDVTLLADCRNGVTDDVWASADPLDRAPPWAEKPLAGAEYAPLASELTRASNYKSWTADLKSQLYQGHDLTIFHCKALKEYSKPGESQGDFRARLRQYAVEARDLAIEKLRKKYATKLSSAESQIRTAEDRVEREKSQSRNNMMQAGTNIFTTVIGAMFGRKLASTTNIGRAGTALRSATRAAGQRSDIARAEDTLEQRQEKLEELESELTSEIEAVKASYQPEALDLEEIVITPRKSDIEVGEVALVWAPWVVDASGIAEPGYSLT
jgi:hypothetical protein